MSIVGIANGMEQFKKLQCPLLLASREHTRQQRR